MPNPILYASALAALFATSSPSADQHQGGEVRVPLSTYQGLVESLRGGSKSAAPAFALGDAALTVTAGESAAAELAVELSVRALEEGSTLIPLLPPGTPVTSASIDGTPAELISTPLGLAIQLKDEASHRVRLSYQAAIARSAQGNVLAFPLPPAPSTKLTATILGSNLDVSIVPAATEATAAHESDKTTLSAVVPRATAAQIAWRTPSATRQGHALSRARYSGVLAGNAVRWKLELDAELFGAEAEIPVLPASLALAELSVDGKPATVFVSGEKFATLVKGKGRHKLTAELAVPVIRENGPPRVELELEPTPMSRFELELPGKKEITAEPSSNITLSSRSGSTFASINSPMTEKISIAWSEAVPEDAKADVRANASLYHLIFVEEGVLHATASIVYEVTRGETNLLELEIPEDVQVNQISAQSGAVADWRVTKTAPGKPSKVSVFLDRKIKGELPFEVKYERLIGAGPEAPDIVGVPLLRMLDVHRQRGMVALLQSQEVSLKPVEENQLTKVGENQLPANIRQSTGMTVAHTYKYVEAKPRLAVQTIAPERKQGRFDAAIDTLISLSDVALKGSASIAVDVKSGKLMVLELQLPPDVNVLGLAAPSLRTHKVKSEDGVQKVEVQFTQEMEGQFTIDLSFERILAEHGKEATKALVPEVSVSSAEVQQGKIAVEALAAVEVTAARAERLSSIDPGALPQQLVLRTTNPILLAYEYVRSDPAPVLELGISRHDEVDTQIATIDTAKYETLFTRDGLAVTTARFAVRNSRKQFLKLKLPESSEVWSVLVDGKAEKPALAEDHLLIQVISSAQGFPVELVYATKIARIGALGTIGATLPRPDMVVTETRWDVFLPDGLAYETPVSNLDLAGGPRAVARGELPQTPSATNAANAANAQTAQTAQTAKGPLRITVPMAGTAFAFEKLYANQSEEAARFTVAYASAGGRNAAHGFALLATLMAWLGAFFLLRPIPKVPRKFALATAALGAIGAILALAVFSAGLGFVLVPSLAAAAILGAPRARTILHRAPRIEH